ncbi:MAG: metallophosphoesterase family protein, partial [Phycisphaerales bacterium]|nr:metallophosphoesterase family protein [Phycisphaerales bacterium]
SNGLPLTITRGPYLQLSTPDSILIRWRTDSPSDSRVRFGPSVGDLTNTVDDPTLTTEHIVSLTGLMPDTMYFYSVGSTTQTLAGDDANHSLKTSPAVGSTDPVRILVLGDSGIGLEDSRNVRDVFLAHTADRPADVWLMLGDNAYPVGSDSEYQRKMFDIYPTTLRTTPLWSSIGNHDALSADSPTQTGVYFDIFSLPKNAQAGGVASGTEAYYSFDYANIHFICLDTSETSYIIGSPMLTWLASDLAATTQQWAIAYFHHPPYSDGHDSDTEANLIRVRQNIVPILEAAGVDLVLSGHSHSYERSYLLNNHYGLSATLTPEMLVDAGDGREDGDGPYTKSAPGLSPNSGTVYAVAGNAGFITPQTLNHPAMYTSMVKPGLMVIDITSNRLDAISINDEGIINDYFTILKAPTPPTCLPDLNNDGSVDFFDISQFLQTQPDWNNDTTFDFFDISDFLIAFVAGCP